MDSLDKQRCGSPPAWQASIRNIRAYLTCVAAAVRLLLLPQQHVGELMCLEGQVFRALEVLVLQCGTRLDDVAPNL